MTGGFKPMLKLDNNNYEKNSNIIGDLVVNDRFNLRTPKIVPMHEKNR